MKKEIIRKGVLMLIIISILFAGCGQKDDAPKCLDIVKACEKVTKEGTFDTWAGYGEEIYDNSFDSLYGVQFDMIDDGAISYTSEGGTADEISIIHLKENSDVSIARDKMQDRINERRQTFAGYMPEEVYKLDNATVMVQGNYVALIISEDNDIIETEIRRVISEGVNQNDR